LNVKVPALNAFFLHRDVMRLGTIKRLSAVSGSLSWHLHNCSRATPATVGGGTKQTSLAGWRLHTTPWGPVIWPSHHSTMSSPTPPKFSCLSTAEKPRGTKDNMGKPPITPVIMSPLENLPVPCTIIRVPAMRTMWIFNPYRSSNFRNQSKSSNRMGLAEVPQK
jgi:hypothetical protein